MRGIELWAAENETRLPRIARNLFQRGNVEVMQFDTSRSHFVVRVDRVNGGSSHFLGEWSVRRTKFEWGEVRTPINFSSCLAISFTNFARVIPLGTSW